MNWSPGVGITATEEKEFFPITVFLQVLRERKRRNSGAAHECFSHEASHQSKAKRSGWKVKCRSRCCESELWRAGISFLAGQSGCWVQGEQEGTRPCCWSWFLSGAFCASRDPGLLYSHWPGASCSVVVTQVQRGEQRLFLSGSLDTQKSRSAEARTSPGCFCCIYWDFAAQSLAPESSSCSSALCPFVLLPWHPDGVQLARTRHTLLGGDRSQGVPEELGSGAVPTNLSSDDDHTASTLIITGSLCRAGAAWTLPWAVEFGEVI